MISVGLSKHNKEFNMKLIFIKTIFILITVLTLISVVCAKEFKVINGNGSLSHDQKWYASIQTVSYRETPFLRFEVINLQKNNYKPSRFFTYSEEMRNAIPEVLLYN